MYELNEEKIRELLTDVLAIKRQDLAIEMGLLSDNLTASQCKAMYKSRFLQWVARGQIKGNKQGGNKTSSVYYSRTQLENLDKAENFGKGQS